MLKRRKLNCYVRVTAPHDMSDKQVLTSLKQLIAVGKQDAEDTVNDPELRDVQDARAALSLSLSCWRVWEERDKNRTVQE